MRPSCFQIYRCIPIAGLLLLAGPQSGHGQTEPAPAAIVNGVRLSTAEVRERVSRLGDGNQLEDDSERFRQALQALIDQQLVLDYLHERSRGATPDELAREMSRWREQLQDRGQTPEDFYRDTGLDEASIRRRLAWRITWPRFANSRLTDEALATYFDRHREEFDGTERRVSHILWPPGKEPPPDEMTAIRDQITAGELSFAEAATRHSAGPSAAQGGALGWIGRHGPMSAPFSEAAFRLQAKEISLPVTSSFGTHLILCHEIRPGTRSWDDVRGEVVRAARRELFRRTADRARRGAEVEVSQP